MSQLDEVIGIGVHGGGRVSLSGVDEDLVKSELPETALRPAHHGGKSCVGEQDGAVYVYSQRRNPYLLQYLNGGHLLKLFGS